MPPKLITIGRIADECQVPIHRVLHILANRTHIEPVAYAGQLRLYKTEAIEMVHGQFPFEIQALADAIAERLTRRIADDVWLDSLPAAALLACSVPTVERLTKAGVIPSVKVGRLRRYRRSVLLNLQNQNGGDV